MSKIVLHHYDYDTKQTISDGEVDTHTIAKAINPEQMAEIIRDWLNSTNSAALRGELVGKKIAESHRTLQGLFYTFLLAAVVQLVCDYPDDRNSVDHGIGRQRISVVFAWLFLFVPGLYICSIVLPHYSYCTIAYLFK